MGQTESAFARITPTLSPEIKKLGFPQRFVASFKPSWVNSPALLLSEPGSDPSFIISMTNGRFDEMVLHSGPTKDDAPLANAKPERYRRNYTITLPSSNSSARQELLHFKPGFFRDKIWFEMEVGGEKGCRKERFEWKKSYGSEIRSVGGWSGWKLVRVKNEERNKVVENDPEKVMNQDPEKIMEDTPNEQDGSKSGRDDIVAVWADATMSFLKVGEFQFQGAGATGEFGQVWALMAVLSCMCVWQKYEYEMYMQSMNSNDPYPPPTSVTISWQTFLEYVQSCKNCTGASEDFLIR
ncbi:hypothetical protein G7Z17_g4554 [Cylindrodendrum hubeiense]|uniref:Uncharacterized protein n=1 Tax=Cylindrodendrum hubeiense TaxID=595255 RepID=A0A9P5LIT8_9HYPO|nr:hypothetical protein G7Z17_g4554 [Cylindrodendrum hubeiense]